MSNQLDSNDGTPNQNDLPYLLYRMDEPLYYPKGDEPKEQRFFELSPDYLPDDMKSKAPQLLSRFSPDEDGGRRVFLGDIQDALLRIPLDQVKVVKRNDQFSLFIPLHQMAAGRLISIFMELRTINDFIKFAGYCRDQLNCQLFAYAYSTALAHREDTKNIRVPSAAEVFPARFVENEVLAGCRRSANLFENPTDRSPVEIPPDATGNDGDIEHRLAYWREDIGINLHHWHWHLVYPFHGPDVVVRKDRRGELFYYLHQQMIARYNIERLCNKLNLVHRLLDWDEPIPEAYFPMLSSDVAGREWPPRPANMRLSNINRPDVDVRFDIEDLRRYKERIFDAINKKRVIAADGTEISIDNDQGIDILGNIVEACVLTPNADYYGNIHNLGHTALAYIHDPQNKYHQAAGVMSEVTTAMRDPVFYRWHAFINDIFEEHKDSLRPYDIKVLSFPGVQVTNVELCSYQNGTCRDEKNTLYTYMMKSDINMSRGLDFVPRGAVLVRVTHLNHDEFDYTIECINSTQRQLLGTIRIFIMPVNGFGNYPVKLPNQRRLAIEMDRFMQPLNPGRNRIVRRSTMSSVTIPFEQVFRDLDTNRPGDTQYEESDRFNFCGCGWPQHLLVPRGTSSGYPMVLFAMISDFNIDRTDPNGHINTGCRTGEIFCGLRDKKYPDKRPMGFPFDRPPRNEVSSIEAFLTPNMAIKPITIFHSREVRQGRLLSNAPPVTLGRENSNSNN